MGHCQNPSLLLLLLQWRFLWRTEMQLGELNSAAITVRRFIHGKISFAHMQFTFTTSPVFSKFYYFFLRCKPSIWILLQCNLKPKHMNTSGASVQLDFSFSKFIFVYLIDYLVLPTILCSKVYSHTSRNIWLGMNQSDFSYRKRKRLIAFICHSF